jgi:hypothetical protein
VIFHDTMPLITGSRILLVADIPEDVLDLYGVDDPRPCHRWVVPFDVMHRYQHWIV